MEFLDINLEIWQWIVLGILFFGALFLSAYTLISKSSMTKYTYILAIGFSLGLATFGFVLSLESEFIIMLISIVLVFLTLIGAILMHLNRKNIGEIMFMFGLIASLLFAIYFDVLLLLGAFGIGIVFMVTVLHTRQIEIYCHTFPTSNICKNI